MLPVQEEAGVGQSDKRQPEGADRTGYGNTDRLFQHCETSVQIETADIEGKLRPQHLEKTQYVIRRLGKRIGNEIDALVADFRERPRATLIARMQVKRKTYRFRRQQPFNPVPFIVMRLAQDIIRGLQALA